MLGVCKLLCAVRRIGWQFWNVQSAGYCGSKSFLEKIRDVVTEVKEKNKHTPCTYYSEGWSIIVNCSVLPISCNCFFHTLPHTSTSPPRALYYYFTSLLACWLPFHVLFLLLSPPIPYTTCSLWPCTGWWWRDGEEDALPIHRHSYLSITFLTPDPRPLLLCTHAHIHAQYVPKELVEVYRDTILPIANTITPNQFEAELVEERWKKEGTKGV